MEAASSSPDEPQKEERPPKPNLCRLLLKQLEDKFLAIGRRADKSRTDRSEHQEDANQLVEAEYRPRSFLRRRAPDEIETAVTQLDQGALTMAKKSFTSNLDLTEFAEAIVSTGTYDADRVLAFVSGVVDLYLEVFRSQGERASERAVNWAQLMNHFIESPEIVMFEGNEVSSAGPKSVSGAENLAQVRRSNVVDCAKHMGSVIHKINWMASLEMLTSVEGTESVYFWSPFMAWETARVVTPQLPADFYDERQKPLWTVHAVAWDNDSQDLAALLSNRFLVFWRLRNRDKGQFQQKKEFRFHATRSQGRNSSTHEISQWEVHLRTLDPKNGDLLRDPPSGKEPSEAGARRDKREERFAAEASQQLDIWWSASMKVWVTADYNGRFLLWDLREHSIATTIAPTKVLQAHSKVITTFLELSTFKFTTGSLDRSVCLWDHRNLSGPEVKLEEHTGSIRAQAYLPLFSSLVTVGCEKRVFVWSIDSTAYRGVRAKLSAHQSNLSGVSAGQRVFVTLDEACIFILWDGATLAALQTTNCFTLGARHVVVMPSLGRICLAGRRLNFFEGNEQGSIALGAAPTKEQVAIAKRREAEGASLKDRAAPKWCGLGPSRGVLLSATEAEVRLHSRICPSQSKALFNAPEGDTISAFCACDSQSYSVLGTAKGGIYFLKYRSGFTLRAYQRRREDIEEWPSAAGGAAASSSSAPGFTSEIVSFEGPPSPGVAGGSSMERIGSPPNSRGANAPRGSAAPAALPEGQGAGPAAEAPAPAAKRSSGLPQNSPTAEDLQRGLSSGITCVLPVEEQRRVYVGTVEGRVIIFSTENDFSVLRWIHLEDASPVTCIDVAPWAEGVEVPDGEEPGLMAVGTQEGVAHIYSLANLRLAGTVNIPRALPEGELQHGSGLRHMRMIQIAAEPLLPVTLLTIDSQSRLRLWGLKVHVQSGRLQHLKLLLDAGQLRESACIPAEWYNRLKQKRDHEAKLRKKKREEEMKAAKARAGKDETAEQNPEAEAQEMEGQNLDEGSQGEGENLAAEARWTSTESVRITAFAALPSGPVQLPIDCLDNQPFEGPTTSATAVAQEKNTPFFQAKADKASEKEPPSSLFITQPPGAARILGKADEEAPVEEFSGSDSDGDAEEIVTQRFAEMPRLPSSAPNALMLGDSAAAESLRAAKEAVAEELGGSIGDGDSLVFIADSGGWLWCLDIAASLSAASSFAPVAVALDVAMVAKAHEEMMKDRGEKRNKRPRGTTVDPRIQAQVANSPAATGLLTGLTQKDARDEIGILVGLPPKQRPEAVQVVGAWPAHSQGISSLVISGSPPALVSVDSAKEVKVWSTTGDIWGHFSMRKVDSRPLPTAVWPPPHVLAVQMSLIRIAKGLCRRMGFSVSHAEELLAAQQQRATPKRSAQRSLNATERRAQIAARRAAKQRQAAAKAAEIVAEAEVSLISPTGEDNGSSAQDSVDAGIEEELTVLAAGGQASQRHVEEVMPPPVPEGDAEVAEAHEEGAAEAPETGPEVTEDARPEEEEDEEEVDVAQVKSDAVGQGTQPGERRSRRAFTQQQMREMIRNHAFSSGFQSYKQFAARPVPQDDDEIRPRRNSKERNEPVRKRQEFFGRKPAVFGVELLTDAEKEAWEAGVKGLGQRSASEGALLRYAQNRVEDMTRSVKKSLGVDVTQTTRRRMRMPSFVSGLDIGKVSQDPTNPSSATGQAVRRLVHSRSQGTGLLLNAGQHVMNSKSTSRSQGSR